MAYEVVLCSLLPKPHPYLSCAEVLILISELSDNKAKLKHFNPS